MRDIIFLFSKYIVALLIGAFLSATFGVGGFALFLLLAITAIALSD